MDRSSRKPPRLIQNERHSSCRSHPRSSTCLSQQVLLVARYENRMQSCRKGIQSQRDQPKETSEVRPFILICCKRCEDEFFRLIFYDAIGKGGGVAAKAFDNGLNPFLSVEQSLISTRSLRHSQEGSPNYYILQLRTGVCHL